MLRYSSSKVSSDYHPRQFEYHPQTRNLVVFGTVKGNVCTVNLDSKEVNFLGHHGKNHFDPILGVCWLKHAANRFITGSSTGKIICSDIRNMFARTQHVIHDYKEYESFEKLTSIHINSSNQSLLVSGYTRNALIMDVETGKVTQNYKGIHGGHINISRFANHSPNLFVTSSFDGSAKSWDLRMTEKQPIYEVKSRTGIVMINFSPDDTYLLSSAHDNEITQYLTVDGSTHRTFAIPKTGLSSNFTRAYYSSSGAYIITGSCEQQSVSVLCSHTGQLVTRVDVCPNREDSTLYVQSLRASPVDDQEMCVLTNYKDSSNRQLFHLKLPLALSHTVHANRLGKIESNNQMLEGVASTVPTSNETSPNASTIIINQTLGLPTLLSTMAYSTPSLGFDLSFLRLQAEAALTTIYIELDDNRKPQARYRSTNVMEAGSGSSLRLEGTTDADIVLLFRRESKQLDKCVEIESCNNSGYISHLAHSSILVSRSSYFAEIVSNIKNSFTTAKSKGQLVTIDMSNNIPASTWYLLPAVLRFLYEGINLADSDLHRVKPIDSVNNSKISDRLKLFDSIIKEGSYKELKSGLSLAVIVELCLRNVCECKQGPHSLEPFMANLFTDPASWRVESFSYLVVDALEKLIMVGTTLKLDNLVMAAAKFLPTFLANHTLHRILTISEKFGLVDLHNIATKYMISHQPIIQALIINNFISNEFNFLQSVVYESTKKRAKRIICADTESKSNNFSVADERPLGLVGSWALDPHHAMVKPPPDEEDVAIAMLRPGSTNLLSHLNKDEYFKLPLFLEHSCVTISNQATLVIGGRDRHSYHAVSCLYLFHHDSLCWTRVTSSGHPDHFPTNFVRQQACLLHPGSRFVVVVGGNISVDNEEVDDDNDDPSPPTRWSRDSWLHVLDIVTMTWFKSPIFAKKSTYKAELDGDQHMYLPYRILFSMVSIEVKHAAKPLSKYDEARENAKFEQCFNSLEAYVRSVEKTPTMNHYDTKQSFKCSESVCDGETWLILFGGVCPVLEDSNNDIVVIICRHLEPSSDLIDDNWKYSFEEVRPKVYGMKPQKRHGHSAAVLHFSPDSGGSRMIVVGGIDREEWSPQQSLVFSLKCSDLNQLTWEPVEIMPSGRTPLPRIGHSLTVLNKDSLVMYGGRSTNRENGTILSDVWIFQILRATQDSGITGSWEEVVTTSLSCSSKQVARFGHQTVRSNTTLFVFGGYEDFTHNKSSVSVHILETEELMLPPPRSDATSNEFAFRSLSHYIRELTNVTDNTRSTAPMWTWLSYKQPEVDALLGIFSTILIPRRSSLSDRTNGGTANNSNKPGVGKGADSKLFPNNLMKYHSIIDFDVSSYSGCIDNTMKDDMLSLVVNAQHSIACPFESDPLSSSLGDSDMEFHIQPSEGEYYYGSSGLHENANEVTIIRAHRSIVKRRCKVFAAMLESDLTESKSARVIVPNCTPQVFVSFLIYLYADALIVDPSDALAVSQLASQYGVDHLASVCEGFLCRHIDDSNIHDLIQYADYLNLHTLKSVCINHLIRGLLASGQSLYPFTCNATPISPPVIRNDLSSTSATSNTTSAIDKYALIRQFLEEKQGRHVYVYDIKNSAA